jgi:hypothetical protein
VSSTGTENYGISRISAPLADSAFITLGDSAAGSRLWRGEVTADGTQHGRGAGYRNNGVDVGAGGNAPGSVAFPGTVGNNNGGLDSSNRRIFNFDAWIGGSRFDVDSNGDGNLDDDGDGLSENPWGINGSSNPSPPITPNVFSPWANLYRFWVDVTDVSVARNLTLSVHAQLNGTRHTADIGSGNYLMELGAGQTLTTGYTYLVPAPGAAVPSGALLALAGTRRRR